VVVLSLAESLAVGFLWVWFRCGLAGCMCGSGLCVCSLWVLGSWFRLGGYLFFFNPLLID